MAYIPHDAIVWGIKNVMQCDCEFDNPQPRTKVATSRGDGIEQKFAQFVCKTHQLFVIQRSYFMACVSDSVEDRGLWRCCWQLIKIHKDTIPVNSLLRFSDAVIRG